MIGRFASLLTLIILWPLQLWAAPVRVAILDFSGSGSGGKAMSDAIELELELADDLLLVPRGQIQRGLARRNRFSSQSIAQAASDVDVDLILTGQGRRKGRGFSIHISVFRHSGSLFFEEDYNVSGKRPDTETLAPLIAESLTEAIADGGVEEPAAAAESSGRDRDTSFDDEDLFVDPDELPDAPDERQPAVASNNGEHRVIVGADNDSGRAASSDGQSDDGGGWGRRYNTPRENNDTRSRNNRDDDDWDRKVLDSPRDDRRSHRDNDRRDTYRRDNDRRDSDRRDSDRSWSDDRDRDRPWSRHDNSPSIADIDQGKAQKGAQGARALIPTILFSGAFDLQQWNYRLASENGTNEVPWGPAYGGSVNAEAWLLPYVGVDAQFRAGKLEIDLGGIPGLQVSAIEVYLYEAHLHLRGQYVLKTGWPGFAVGGRLGYRLIMANAAAQSPFTVVPSYTAHILAPGLDFRLPLHPQYAVLNIGAEVWPFAAYSEAPDEPGAAGSASAWGYRVDLSLRSTIAYGIFLELRGYYEELFVSYSDVGTRVAMTGGNHTAGQVGDGIRGASLGVGWSF